MICNLPSVAQSLVLVLRKCLIVEKSPRSCGDISPIEVDFGSRNSYSLWTNNKSRLYHKKPYIH